MGGYGINVELVSAPEDPDALARLHRDVWAIVVRRLLTVVTEPAGVDVLDEYMYVYIEDDIVGGFEEAWSATSEGLDFWFTDAAGLCYGEMYASLHWTELVLLEQWPAVAAAAAAIGARVVPPRRTMAASILAGGTAVFELDATPELDALLTGPAERVFFAYQDRLAYTEVTEDLAGATVTVLGDDDIALEDVPEPDQARITELIRAGRCLCQPCRILRAARGIPIG